MTLLISTFAAIISTVVWYKNAPEDKMHVRMLCWMFWGASLMWFVDSCFEYAELGAAYFTPAAADMLNDAFLGFSVVALAMIIWLVYLLVTDPEGKVRASLMKNKDEKSRFGKKSE